MNVLIIGLLAAIFYALQQFFATRGLRKIDKYFFLLIGNLAMLALFFILSLKSGFTMPSADTFIVLFFVGLIGALALLSFYKALETGSAAIVSPIANSASMVTILLSIYFFNEKLSFLQLFGAFFVIAGIFLVSFKYEDVKKLNFKIAEKGIIFALLTFFGWGVYAFLLKPVVNDVGPILSAFYTESAVMIFSIIIFFGKLTGKRKLKFKKNGIKDLSLSAAAIAIAVLLFSFGIKDNSVSLMSALTGTKPLFVLALSTFFLKEKTELNQKIGVFLSVFGVMLMSM